MPASLGVFRGDNNCRLLLNLGVHASEYVGGGMFTRLPALAKSLHGPHSSSLRDRDSAIVSGDNEKLG